jgi:hypothetical protein
MKASWISSREISNVNSVVGNGFIMSIPKKPVVTMSSGDKKEEGYFISGIIEF